MSACGGPQINVPGQPKAKKSVAGRDTRYNPSANEMRNWEEVARQQVPKDQASFKGPVTVHLKCFFQRPLNHLKRGGRGLRPTAPVIHFQKPDADNLQKFVGDCLSGIAYHDDCQITDLRVQKFWSVCNPRTEVTIEYFNCAFA